MTSSSSLRSPSLRLYAYFQFGSLSLNTPARPWHHWVRRLSQVSLASGAPTYPGGVGNALEDALPHVRSSSWYVLKLSPRVLNLFESGHWTGTTCRSRSVVPFAAFSTVHLQCLPCRPSRETPDQGRLVYQHSFGQASSWRLLLVQLFLRKRS